MTLAMSQARTASLVFSPDGHLLAAANLSRLAFWDTKSWRSQQSIPTAMARALEFSGDGSRLAGLSGTRDQILLIKNPGTKPEQISLENAFGKELSIAFSPDGKFLAGGGTGFPMTVWDSASGRTLARWTGKTGNVSCPVFTPDGQSLIFASQDGRVRSWHFNKKNEPTAQLAGHKKEVWALAFTPDGTGLLSAGDDHAIKLWNTRDGHLQLTLNGHKALVTSLAINRTGTLLASASFDNTVRLWELSGGKPGLVFEAHTDRIRAVAFSPDGLTVASAGSDKTVRLWDVNRGAVKTVFTGHTDTVRALAFDPSGSFLLSSSDDRTINVTSLKGVEKSFPLACPKHNSSLAFSPDGTILVTGDDWGNVTFWNTATWTRLTSVKGSDATIWGLAFSPDGRTLAAACGDAKVRLCDPISGQVLMALDGHSDRVNAVAFSPDGRTLASADHEGVVKLWQAGR